MTKFTRKLKIEMENIQNKEQNINVTICIDSDHTDMNIDTLLLTLTKNVESMQNYKPKEKEVKKSKKNKFGGNFV